MMLHHVKVILHLPLSPRPVSSLQQNIKACVCNVSHTVGFCSEVLKGPNFVKGMEALKELGWNVQVWVADSDGPQSVRVQYIYISTFIYIFVPICISFLLFPSLSVQGGDTCCVCVVLIYFSAQVTEETASGMFVTVSRHQARVRVGSSNW